MARPDDLAAQLLPKLKRIVDDDNKRQEIGVLMAATKWVLWVCMSLLFGLYILIIAASPVAAFAKFRLALLIKMMQTPLGFSGGILLIFAAPILVLVAFALISLEVSSKTSNCKQKAKGGASLKNLPVVTKGLMGIVSAAELLWIVLFLAIFGWVIANYITHDFKNAEIEPLKPFETIWGKRIKMTGLRLGFIGIICLNLLFLPISRGSVLLRAIDIPFEHATKYHVWLGHFMMTLFTLHGLFYSIAWYSEGRLIKKLLEWAPHEIANLPGVIALLAGITMWVTSFGWVRQKYFELFFYTHQLYIVFVVFMAFHVGDFIFNIAFSGLFLFSIDRFLRFCQSRNSVGIISTKLMPCGTYELVIAKPPGMKYHALSFIFLNVPGISALQWHPFSVSSSPYDGDDRLKVLIKPYGEWTHQLQDVVLAAVKSGPCPFTIKAAVEGPYGHESDYFLHYEALVLVAGGIGVSPFVAIIRDLLQRHKRDQHNLPSHVTLIWAVQKSEELQLLDLISASSICPDYKEKFQLHIHAFVTRETKPISLERNPETPDSQLTDHFKKTRILYSLSNVEAFKKPMSILVGTGSNLWISACFLASLVGYFAVTLLISHFVVKPNEKKGFEAEEEFSTGLPLWVKGLFNIISMFVGVVGFGGVVIAFWSWLSSRSTKNSEDESTQLLLDSDDDAVLANESADRLVHPSNTQFGHRPNLRELFDSCAKQQRPGVKVGVLVCGPESLQTSVAETCQAFSTVDYKRSKVAFNYHSVSFDL